MADYEVMKSCLQDTHKLATSLLFGHTCALNDFSSEYEVHKQINESKAVKFLWEIVAFVELHSIIANC